jgi:2-keto-3-deoxy-L-fuconate dehydrogenase
MPSATPPFRLDDKLAVVTGAGSGIGRAVALLFAQQGAEVAVLDRDARAAEETAGMIDGARGGPFPVVCDVSRADEVAEVFAAIGRRRGGLDVLVNNAGIAHVGTVETTSEADFDRVFAVNVKGAFLCTKAAIPHLLQRRGSVILNMSSIAAIHGIPERFAYSASKGALQAMTCSIAIDYMKRIRCNAICPARVHTPFVDGFLDQAYPGRQAEILRQLSEYQPLGRMGRPEEVAALALYLCSDEASFITGQAFPIDGGVLLA